MTEILAKRMLVEMENANAWIGFLTAQAIHDMHVYGGWQQDYAKQADLFQKIYKNSGKAFHDITHINHSGE